MLKMYPWNKHSSMYHIIWVKSMIDEIKASVLLIVHMLKMRLLFSNKHKTSIVSKKACASEFLRFGSFCPYLNQFPSKASQCFECLKLGSKSIKKLVTMKFLVELICDLIQHRTQSTIANLS